MEMPSTVENLTSTASSEGLCYVKSDSLCRQSPPKKGMRGRLEIKFSGLSKKFGTGNYRIARLHHMYDESGGIYDDN
jgi:hypothetical protein